MNKTRNGFMKSLRYVCLMGVIALGFMTIVATGGGGNGDGDGDGDNNGASPNIVLLGSLNVTTDYFGDIKIFGELKNTGNKAAIFIEIKFTFYDSSSNVIGTDYTYVDGSCMKISTINTTSDTALVPNEFGAFELWTNIDANLVSSYTYRISFDAYDLEQPTANLVVDSINIQTDYFDDLELLGTATNLGTTGLIFGKISFAIKNAAGLIIDTDFSYIEGENVYLKSIDSYTDTALNVGSTGTFDVSTSIGSTEYSTYYYKTSWSDANISNGIAEHISDILSNAVIERNYDHLNNQDRREARKERDMRIERIKNKVKQLIQSNETSDSRPE